MESLKKIKLVDKILVLFMIILILQTIFTIFISPIDENSDFSKIDLVTRTSISGIFGYLLSGNFMDTNHYEKRPEKEKTIQMIIIACIGLVSLLILLFVRNFEIEKYTSIAALSQMRDLASGSIGFFLGQPSSSKEK